VADAEHLFLGAVAEIEFEIGFGEAGAGEREVRVDLQRLFEILGGCQVDAVAEGLDASLVPYRGLGIGGIRAGEVVAAGCDSEEGNGKGKQQRRRWAAGVQRAIESEGRAGGGWTGEPVA
jgi:hypothetical protein